MKIAKNTVFTALVFALLVPAAHVVANDINLEQKGKEAVAYVKKNRKAFITGATATGMAVAAVIAYLLFRKGSDNTAHSVEAPVAPNHDPLADVNPFIRVVYNRADGIIGGNSFAFPIEATYKKEA